MKTRLLMAALALLCVLSAGMPCAAVTQLSENWESYTNGVTPYGAWQLQTGTWGGISTPGIDGGGKRFSIAAGQKTRVQYPIDLDGHSHVVLQGWLLDSTGNNRSVIGLGRSATATDSTLIRMGAGGAANYTIQYYEGGTLITLDTGIPVEAGWHFMRLDITYDGNPSNLWNVIYRIWNTARTVEKIGTFTWHFDRINSNYVTLGAAAITTGAVSWDDVKVGSITDVGTPPFMAELITATASSQTTDFYPSNAIDNNPGTIWSSAGHGGNPIGTEWLAVDYGRLIRMTGVSITPRSGGLCFPVDYRIEYTADWIAWTTEPGMVFTDQPVPTDVVTHTFIAPVMARAVRIYATKLRPDPVNHYLQIAEFKALYAEPWVYPTELRSKKVIGAGMYTALNVHDSETPTPAFLADHPEYLANHPFDGVSIPVALNRAWCTGQGLITESAYALHTLTMTRLAIPYSAVQDAITDLNRVSWGHVTDNFLWYGVLDGTRGGDNDTRYPVDPASSSDWSVVTRNAALCARMCRETNLKGFIMDTEQYSNYESGEPYPFGKGTPAVWRVRGQQWIQAVQAEFPGIKIVIFFSWGPETQPGGWTGYENLRHFMNGILDGIQSPAQLVNAWEMTFWYGAQRDMGDGSFMRYPGDRAVYAQTCNDIKNVWRNYSDNPTKYDQFVKAGMAAWVESDPYNLTPGWPSGYLVQAGWANLPYALAYSDEYVWVWSEKTHYPRTMDVLNPFLASIANRTFNTGLEAATILTEDFQADPLKRGWYFDFDMLSIGREVHEGWLPAMNLDSVAYNWDPAGKAVRVRGGWMTGLTGETVADMFHQRCRYVHPLQSLGGTDHFQADLDFQVESFGSDTANPIVLGLFNSSSLVNRQSFTLQIRSATDLRITLVGDGTASVSVLTVAGGLKTGRTYRISFDHDGATGLFHAILTDMTDSSLAAEAQGAVPGSVGEFQLDEVGASIWDVDPTSTPPAQAYVYHLKRAVVHSGVYIGGGIGGAKDWPDGFSGDLVGKLLHLDGGTFGYIQEPDRSSGIRVEGSISASEDHLVTVSGKLRTNSDGERYIELTSMTQGVSMVADPVVLNNRELGGGLQGLQAGVQGWSVKPVPGSYPVTYGRLLGTAVGVNNIGLLVTLCGEVTHIGSDYFYVHDGSGIDDGDELVKGVRVVGVYDGLVGDYVMVTGASSCLKKDGNTVRLLRPRRLGDIVTIRKR